MSVQVFPAREDELANSGVEVRRRNKKWNSKGLRDL